MSQEYKNTTKADAWTVCISKGVTHFAVVSPGCITTTGQENLDSYTQPEQVADKMIERYRILNNNAALLKAALLCEDLGQGDKAKELCQEILDNGGAGVDIKEVEEKFKELDAKTEKELSQMSVKHMT